MQFTGTGMGMIAAFLVMLMFSAFGMIEVRAERGSGVSGRAIPDAAGFGLLPGIAVWKVFEQNTRLGKGIMYSDPFSGFALITEEGRYAVSRAEMILAALCFAGIILWMMLRRDELHRNGDLLLTVLCVWGLTRAFTESFREEILLREGVFNLTQILMLAAADVSMAVWTVRLEAAQKNTAISVLEWIAILSCETVLVLNNAGILSAGSRIGNLAVNAGCVILSMTLMLSAGKDSRS